MIQHEVTIHLNKPVEQVFAFLMDTSKLTVWQSNLIKSEQLTEGPLRAGSRFREVRRINNKETEIQGELQRWNQISGLKRRRRPSRKPWSATYSTQNRVEPN